MNEFYTNSENILGVNQELIIRVISDIIVRIFTDAFFYSLFFFLMILVIFGMVEIVKDENRRDKLWNGRYENV